jgi:hypothetical protein
MDDYFHGLSAAPAGFAPPPILIAGDSDAALDRAARTVEASGLRVADRVRIEHAPERLEQQIAASALWIELDADCGAPMDRLLDQVNRDAGTGRYCAIVAAPAQLLDAHTVGDPQSRCLHRSGCSIARGIAVAGDQDGRRSKTGRAGTQAVKIVVHFGLAFRMIGRASWVNNSQIGEESGDFGSTSDLCSTQWQRAIVDMAPERQETAT